VSLVWGGKDSDSDGWWSIRLTQGSLSLACAELLCSCGISSLKHIWVLEWKELEHNVSRFD